MYRCFAIYIQYSTLYSVFQGFSEIRLGKSASYVQILVKNLKIGYTNGVSNKNGKKKMDEEQKIEIEQDDVLPVEEATATAEESPAESADAIAPQESTAESAEIIAPQESAEKATEATALKRTRAEEKRLAALYMIFAAAIIFCVYVVQILHLLERPLFSRIYYGNLPKLMYNACSIILWVPMLVGVHLLLKKYTGRKAFHRSHREISLKRILLLYACTVVPIFIVSAALGFKLKIVYELGSRITGVQAWSNASAYLYGGVKLLFFVIFIELVQETGELLYKGEKSPLIPWGGIAAMLIFGFGDVIVAYATGSGIMFAWLYLAFDLIYGVIFLVSNRSFYVTFILSLIIFIL